jgi:hypothetical protein
MLKDCNKTVVNLFVNSSQIVGMVNIKGTVQLE